MGIELFYKFSCKVCQACIQSGFDCHRENIVYDFVGLAFYFVESFLGCFIVRFALSAVFLLELTLLHIIDVIGHAFLTESDFDVRRNGPYLVTVFIHRVGEVVYYAGRHLVVLVEVRDVFNVPSFFDFYLAAPCSNGIARLPGYILSCGLINHQDFTCVKPLQDSLTDNLGYKHIGISEVEVRVRILPVLVGVTDKFKAGFFQLIQLRKLQVRIKLCLGKVLVHFRIAPVAFPG